MSLDNTGHSWAKSPLGFSDEAVTKDSVQPTDRGIGLLVFPAAHPDVEFGRGFIIKLVALLSPVAREVFLITGNFNGSLPYENVSLIEVTAPKVDWQRESLASKAFRFLLAQFTLSEKLVRLNGKVDIVLVFLSGGSLVLPFLVARLLGKKIALITTGSVSRSWRTEHASLAGRFSSALILGIERLSYGLSHMILTYSPSIVDELNLQRYRDKVLTTGARFVDTALFARRKGLDERGNVVGYFGRLSEEKGVVNLLEAMPGILESQSDVRFVVGGEGELRGRLEAWLEREGLSDKARFLGWIPHHELPKHLNELRLLLLPSYTEGLPNIMLEAMACGTPVLATPVGGVPDVIRDGETGFCMASNSPQCIAENVTRALNHPNLEGIARQAVALIEREYTYGAAVERYRRILGILSSRR